MAMHLGKLAPRHIESKFVKIDSDKCPFFVEKLKVRTMPTVLIFKDGVAAEKIRGFEDLADTMPEVKSISP
jgi:thioredoxin-like negative regulator of GroEL